MLDEQAELTMGSIQTKTTCSTLLRDIFPVAAYGEGEVEDLFKFNATDAARFRAGFGNRNGLLQILP